MSRLVLIGALLLPATVAAQQQPPPDPQMQALTGQLVDELQQVIQWRVRALNDEAEIAKLQDEINKLKKGAATDPLKR